MSTYTFETCESQIIAQLGNVVGGAIIEEFRKGKANASPLRANYLVMITAVCGVGIATFIDSDAYYNEVVALEKKWDNSIAEWNKQVLDPSHLL